MIAYAKPLHESLSKLGFARARQACENYERFGKEGGGEAGGEVWGEVEGRLLQIFRKMMCLETIVTASLIVFFLG